MIVCELVADPDVYLKILKKQNIQAFRTMAKKCSHFVIQKWEALGTLWMFIGVFFTDYNLNSYDLIMYSVIQTPGTWLVFFSSLFFLIPFLLCRSNNDLPLSLTELSTQSYWGNSCLYSIQFNRSELRLSADTFKGLLFTQHHNESNLLLSCSLPIHPDSFCVFLLRILKT